MNFKKLPTEKEIESKAFEWVVDYKPWDEDLVYTEYAKHGFEVGYKRAVEELIQKGEYIICSAIYINDKQKHKDQPTNIEIGYIVSGRRHNNCYATLEAIIGSDNLSDYLRSYHDKTGQGFITSLNRYVDRKEAMVIAKRENQLLVPSLYSGNEEGILTSEDLFPMDWATMKY